MVSGEGNASERNSATAFSRAATGVMSLCSSAGSVTWSMMVRDGLKPADALCAT